MWKIIRYLCAFVATAMVVVMLPLAHAGTVTGTTWFDSNGDGIQNDGTDAYIEGAAVELYDPATTTIIASTSTDNNGQYQFSSADGLQPSTFYELRIRKLDNKAPVSDWSLTDMDAGSDDSLDSDAILAGNYWTIYITSPTAGSNASGYGFGFNALSEEGCLSTGSTGVSDETITNNHPNAYDFLFSGQQVTGYCAERSDADPLAGDNYEVRDTDRQGLTEAQRQKLRRLYSALEDPDIIFQIAAAFGSGKNQMRLDDLMRYMTWYYTHYNEDMASVISTHIDGNSNYTVAQQTAMGAILQKVADRVAGLNGETQYPEQTIFWMWNLTDTSRQDMIVPARLAKGSSCAVTEYISGVVYTDSNDNDSYDPGAESGIGSISVNLLNDADGSSLATTSTAADGSYSFNGLDTSLTYRIEVDTTDTDLPAGYNIGTLNPLTGVTVTAGNITANQNFGFDPLGVKTIDYILRWSAVDERYHVYMLPIATPSPDLSITSQVTIRVPHATGADRFELDNLQSEVANTIWSPSSRADAPTEDGTVDYISFTLNTNNASAFNWQKDIEQEVFSFGNSGKCLGAVELMDNSDPFNVRPNSHGTNPGNQFTNLGWGSVDDNNYRQNLEGPAVCNPKSTVSGKVFEDVNYGGGAGRDASASGAAGVSGATVEVYDASGNFVESTTTAADGAYDFSIPDGDYYVRVVNNTVSSSRSGSDGSELGIQTFRSNGATSVTNEVGGRQADAADATTHDGTATLNTGTFIFSGGALDGEPAQSVTPVTVAGGNVSGIDFGFNFSTVVNTNGDGQGSLHQFLQNAAKLSNTGLAQSGFRKALDGSNEALPAGVDTSIFMIPSNSDPLGRTVDPRFNANGVAVIDQSGSVLTLSGANSNNTAVDGTTQTVNIGDTNTTLQGSGGTVGVDNLTLSQVSGPEVQINGRQLWTDSDNFQYRGMAHKPTGTALNLEGNTGYIIEMNIIGTDAHDFSAPATPAGNDLVDVFFVSDTTFRNNLVGFTSRVGLYLDEEATNWIIENNEFRDNESEHIDLETKVNGIMVRGNLMVGGGSYAAIQLDDSTSAGTDTIENNTIENMALYGIAYDDDSGANDIVRRNIIRHNGDIGIKVSDFTGTTSRLLISQNHIHGNDGLGIDLANDGVTLNDANDADSGPNDLLNTPELNQISYSGTTVDYDFDLDVPAGDYLIEFFDNPSGLDPSGYGEGEVYLGSVSITHSGVGSENFSGSFSASQTPSDTLHVVTTATANIGVTGITSEFSAPMPVTSNILGKVFEDVNYGGGAGRGISAAGATGVSGATVELYDASGNFVDSTATAADGAYSFSSIADGVYHVRVVNSTVRSTRSGSDGTEQGIQTFRSNGVTAVTNEVGGHKADATDAEAHDGTATLDTASFMFNGGTLAGKQAQSITTIALFGDASDVDFGFNFNTVVNTNDSGQGSLRQFILNSNLLGDEAALAQVGRTAGKEHSIFMLPVTDPGYTDTDGLANSGDEYWRIGLLNGLPETTAADTVLDASTQSGAQCDPALGRRLVVELEGSAINNTTATAIKLAGARNEVRGFAIGSNANQMTFGIYLRNRAGSESQPPAIGSKISCNNIGANPLGQAYATLFYADAIGSFPASVTIGGDTPADRNIIGNADDDGVEAEGSGAIIRNNYIGLSADGFTPLTINDHAVAVWSPVNGGTLPAGESKLIEDNKIAVTNNGIRSRTENTTVRNNTIGLAEDGETVIGGGRTLLLFERDNALAENNTFAGGGNGGNPAVVLMDGASFVNNRVGFTVSGNQPAGVGSAYTAVTVRSASGTSDTGILIANNHIGNAISGVTLDASADVLVTITNNHIGIAPDGVTAAGNSFNGVYLSNTSTGEAFINANNIANNGTDGIGLRGPNGQATILGNSIYANGELGIDLANDGITVNDANDADTGPNGLLNFPLMSQAYIDSGDLVLRGCAPAGAIVEVFEADVSTGGPATPGDNRFGKVADYGEGERYLTSFTEGDNTSDTDAAACTMATDSDGNNQNGMAAFAVTLPLPSGMATGDVITLTATLSGVGTSEFSPVATIIVPRTVGGTVFEDVNYGGGNGRAFTTPGASGVGGATVEIYGGSGAFINATTTAADGSYTLPNLPDGNYYVRVVSSTVSSNRSGSTGAELPVMTYRTDGVTATTNEIGGRNPAAIDAGVNNSASQLNGVGFTFSSGVLTGQQAQAVQPVTVAGMNLGNVSFGFNFDTIVNANNAGQGSLRQFILNANILGNDNLLVQSGLAAGKENAVLMLPTSDPNYNASGNYWSIPLQSALPVITDTIVLDSSLQSGFIDNPVIELNGTNAGASANGLTLGTGSNGSLLRKLAINRFGGAGIYLDGSSNHTIQANRIGTDPSGLFVRSNSGDGILLDDASNNLIGGVDAADANQIRGNGSDGIAITGAGSQSNTLLGNSIYANGGLGIDLADNGVSNNDAGDTDTGPNNLLNFPEAPANAFAANGSRIVTYDIDLDVPSGDYRMELFTSSAKDPSGNGEGQTFIGHKDISHPGTGKLNFKGTLNANRSVATGAFISATLTRKTGVASFAETSEFSGIKDSIPTSVCTDLLDNNPGDPLPDLVIDENSPVITLLEARDSSGNPITYVISGGADLNYFTIVGPDTDPTLDCTTVKFITNGVVITKSMPVEDAATRAIIPPGYLPPPGNYELPLDKDRDNVYELQIQATYASGQKVTRDLNVRVMNVNEPPYITSGADVDFTEDSTAYVLDIASQDQDQDVSEGNGLTYRISGGADAAYFEVHPDMGVLQFRGTPDYDAPVDSNRDNVYLVEVSVTDPAGLSGSKLFRISVKNNTADDGVTLKARAMLQGAYDSSSGLMKDSLNKLKLLPVQQPYSAAPFSYPGTESLSPLVQETDGNNAIVDWVLVELRTSTSAIAARRAVMLQRDGDLVDAQTGSTDIHFPRTPPGNYYVSVRHRNHLAVMSASPVSLGDALKLVDFTQTSTAVRGTEARLLSGSKALLWAGDINGSNTLSANGPGNDVTSLLSGVITSMDNVQAQTNYIIHGYLTTDLNMDGKTLFTGPGNDANMLVGNIILHPQNSNFAANYIVRGSLAQ